MFPIDIWHRKRVRPALILIFLESVLVTLIGTGTAWLIFPAAAGLIAVFLICVGMQESFSILLECNRKDIWEGRLDPYMANVWLVSALVSIFMGCFLAFSGIAWSLPADIMRVIFSMQLQLSPLEAINLTRLQFGQFEPLFWHNVSLLLMTIAVSAVFRSGGALLILSWNASIWALSYAHISRLTVVMGGSSLTRIVTAVAIGITPHLVIEASAYITGTMAGIFVAKAFEKYRWRDRRFSRVIIASLTLAAAGFLLLFLGALVECRWPAWCIGKLLAQG